MTRSCSRGSIRRKSYIRRSKSGKRTRVPSVCIKDRGKPGKGPKILPIPERGVLSRYGYANVKDMPDQKRRVALKRAIEAYGHRKVIGHLVLIANYTRISDPSAYAIFKGDQEHVSRLYKELKSKSKSTRRSSSRSKSRSRYRHGSTRSKHRHRSIRHRRRRD